VIVQAVTTRGGSSQGRGSHVVDWPFDRDSWPQRDHQLPAGQFSASRPRAYQAPVALPLLADPFIVDPRSISGQLLQIKTGRGEVLRRFPRSLLITFRSSHPPPPGFLGRTPGTRPYRNASARPRFRRRLSVSSQPAALGPASPIEAGCSLVAQAELRVIRGAAWHPSFRRVTRRATWESASAWAAGGRHRRGAPPAGSSQAASSSARFRRSRRGTRSGRERGCSRASSHVRGR
jgi:hypothetical protein